MIKREKPLCFKGRHEGSFSLYNKGLVTTGGIRLL